MLREEEETHLRYLSSVVPILKDKNDALKTMREMLVSISNLRWLRDDTEQVGQKDLDTVATLVDLLAKNIGEKQNRRGSKDVDNAVED